MLEIEYVIPESINRRSVNSTTSKYTGPKISIKTQNVKLIKIGNLQ